jgi:hypothetical protein
MTRLGAYGATLTLGAARIPARSRSVLLPTAGFLLAAGIVAGVRAVAPFERGWWLVAYLALVGGLAQALLATGLPAPAGHRARPVRLWSIGTIAVALADMLDAPGGVLAGSLALITALVLFARTAANGPSPPWRDAVRSRGLYLLLVVFMVASVVIGCYLADALPGQ